MPTTLCLNAEQIQQFLLGLAPRAEAEALARHLEECPACSDLADSLSARDSLVEAVEQAKTPIPIGVEPVVVETMIARLQALAAPELDTSPGGWIRPDQGRSRTSPETPDVERLGRYQILEVLGRGGMGKVYLAYDPLLRRHLALKVMNRSQAAVGDSAERFLREARLAAQMHHDNVVPIFDVGEDNGVPFIAMPVLEGESLAARLARAPEAGIEADASGGPGSRGRPGGGDTGTGRSTVTSSRATSGSRASRPKSSAWSSSILDWPGEGSSQERSPCLNRACCWERPVTWPRNRRTASQ